MGGPVPGLVHELLQSISMWRSFLLVGDTGAPVVAVGSTLVNEMYFYVVFAILLALRMPPVIGTVARHWRSFCMRWSRIAEHHPDRRQPC